MQRVFVEWLDEQDLTTLSLVSPKLSMIARELLDFIDQVNKKNLTQWDRIVKCTYFEEEIYDTCNYAVEPLEFAFGYHCAWIMRGLRLGDNLSQIFSTFEDVAIILGTKKALVDMTVTRLHDAVSSEKLIEQLFNRFRLKHWWLINNGIEDD